MYRPISSWKLFFLSAAIAGPIGYWVSSHSGISPSPAYAQQLVDSNAARAELDQGQIAHAEQLSKVFRDVSKSAKPSVVSIKSLVSGRAMSAGRGRGLPPGLPPELEQFFGEGSRNPQLPRDEEDAPQQRGGLVPAGLGSGVIVRPDGYILTNNHVVANAQELEVYLSDDTKYKAKVVGTDPRTDLAVLKIDATGLVATPIGDSSKSEVGDWVIAIGSPFGLTQTVTAGIISATNRTGQDITLYDEFIQTDAAINPGNSGGPLLNLRGEIIGINTAIASRGGGYNGVCFAVPSNTAARVLSDIIASGSVSRGFVGILPVSVTSELEGQLSLPSGQKGAVVQQVTKGMPADKAGLRVGDVIVEIDGKPIPSDSAMRRTVGESKPGTTLKFKLLRDGKQIVIPITVASLDEKALAQNETQQMERIQKLGIAVDTVPATVAKKFELEEGEGVLVIGLDRSGKFPGVKIGNVILSVNGTKVGSPEEFMDEVSKLQDGDALVLVIRDERADKMVTIK
jgi:serine protease Do